MAKFICWIRDNETGIIREHKFDNLLPILVGNNEFVSVDVYIAYKETESERKAAPTGPASGDS